MFFSNSWSRVFEANLAMEICLKKPVSSAFPTTSKKCSSQAAPLQRKNMLKRLKQKNKSKLIMINLFVQVLMIGNGLRTLHLAAWYQPLQSRLVELLEHLSPCYLRRESFRQRKPEKRVHPMLPDWTWWERLDLTLPFRSEIKEKFVLDSVLKGWLCRCKDNSYTAMNRLLCCKINGNVT